MSALLFALWTAARTAWEHDVARIWIIGLVLALIVVLLCRRGGPKS